MCIYQLAVIAMRGMWFTRVVRNPIQSAKNRTCNKRLRQTIKKKFDFPLILLTIYTMTIKYRLLAIVYTGIWFQFLLAGVFDERKHKTASNI